MHPALRGSELGGSAGVVLDLVRHFLFKFQSRHQDSLIFFLGGFLRSGSWQEGAKAEDDCALGKFTLHAARGQRQHIVFGPWAFFGEKDFFVIRSPHSKQSWLIQHSNPPPLKMIPPTAQEHLGMFSANVITASVSGQLFKGPFLLSSHFNTWWCHGPLWGRRNSSNQLPLMTFSFTFFFRSPFARFFLSSSFFLPPGYNWGSLYGLIKQPPSTTPPPRHHWLAPLSETLYEKCMPLFKCIGSAHRHPGLLFPAPPRLSPAC